jgi:hypothetical protein
MNIDKLNYTYNYIKKTDNLKNPKYKPILREIFMRYIDLKNKIYNIESDINDINKFINYINNNNDV